MQYHQPPQAPAPNATNISQGIAHPESTTVPLSGTFHSDGITQKERLVALASEGLGLLRALVDAPERLTLPSSALFAADSRLDKEVSHAYAALLECKNVGESAPLAPAELALSRLNRTLGEIEIAEALTPAVGCLKQFLQEALASLTNPSRCEIEELTCALDHARESTNRTLTELAESASIPWNYLPTEYVELCLMQFTRARRDLLDYGTYADLTPPQEQRLLDVVFAVDAFTEGRHRSKEQQQVALQTVLHESVGACQKGLSSAALHSIVALSAEILASIRLGKPVTCAKVEEKSLLRHAWMLPSPSGSSRKEWLKALGSEPGANAVTYLAKNFTLSHTSPKELQRKLEQTKSAADDQNKLEARVDTLIETLRSHIRRKVSAEGKLDIPEDSNFAYHGWITAVIQRPWTLWVLPVVCGPNIAPAVHDWVMYDGVRHPLLNAVGCLGGLLCARVLPLSAFPIDTSKATNNSALDRLCAFCQANNVELAHQLRDQLTWRIRP